MSIIIGTLKAVYITHCLIFMGLGYALVFDNHDRPDAAIWVDGVIISYGGRNEKDPAGISCPKGVEPILSKEQVADGRWKVRIYCEPPVAGNPGSWSFSND